MSNPTAAMLVIGDEILSGRTREANAYHLAGRLVEVGIDLTEIRVVPDDHQVIVDALRSLRTAHDHVFTSGGIGPTHDDITADAVAAAFEVGISVREDARRLVEAAIGSRRPVTDDQPRVALLERSVQIAQALEQELRPSARGVPAVDQPVVDDEDRHEPVGAPPRRLQRRMVMDAQVAAKPEDRGLHSTECTAPPRRGSPPPEIPPAASLTTAWTPPK